MLWDDPKELNRIEMAFSVVFGRHKDLNVFCPFHEDARSHTPSCSVSSLGVFHCKACNAKGTYTKFYAQAMGISEQEAQKQLEEGVAAQAPKVRESAADSIPVAPITEDVAVECTKMLQVTPKWLRYLKTVRGFTDATIQEAELGCDESRITIPVRNEDGKLVNVRRYLPDSAKLNLPKMVKHRRGDGTPTLYPWKVLDTLEPGDELIVCEGEWDCLLLNQHGFKAVTNTGSAMVWHDDWTGLLSRYRIVIIYDVHDKASVAVPEGNLGQRMAQLRAAALRQAGAPSVKVVELPLPAEYVGGDITDWFMKAGRTAEELRNLINNTPEWSTEVTKAVVTPLLTLNEASASAHYYQQIRIRALVAGKGTAPYLVPSKIRVVKIGEDGLTQTVEHTFTAWDGYFIGMIDCTQAAQKRLIAQVLDISAGTKFTVEVLDTVNIEQVFLIPAIDQDKDQGPYVLRTAYYVGKGLETNRVYDFTGMTLPHPSSQAATHLLVEAIPAASDIESFSLTPERIDQLRTVFSSENPYTKMNDIAAAMADHVTHIYGRKDLHIGVSLVFHSCLSFHFDGVLLRKGWLEALVLGDTRTGKGFVTEGLSRYYGLGDVVSGENLSIAGIVGGVQKVGDHWTLVWGRIPLSDRRLVILDEAGSLSHDDIGRLSRIRSEGVAEITKIISEKTRSRTRLIWLANPRPQAGAAPRVISDYNFGIEAVPELIGAAEDVARFDFALIVARNEVSVDLINQHHEPSAENPYAADLCRDLILWAWSRLPDQIVFEEGVTDLAMQGAKALGASFSGRICLIQGEDVRFKLARIAVAVAAATFSTHDGVTLTVRRAHMEFAYNFLVHIYSKPCSGYAQLSVAEIARNTLKDVSGIIRTLQIAPSMADIVDGLDEHRLITPSDICDYASVDIQTARTIISELVRRRALMKEHNGYVKRPAFKTLLLRLRNTAEPAVTQEVSDDTESEGYISPDPSGGDPNNPGQADNGAAAGT